MQSMLTAVRNAGANNLVLLAGIEYANDLSQWLTYKPTDPAKNFAASCHVYPNSNGSFITMAMSCLDGLSPPQSYVAWSWSTDDTPVIISNLNGTAACSGITYKAHLLATPH